MSTSEYSHVAPPVLEGPERAERPANPAVVAAFLGQHARELADDERFGNAPHERYHGEQQQREAGSDRGDEGLRGEGAARHGEEQHEHDGARRERAAEPDGSGQ